MNADNTPVTRSNDSNPATTTADLNATSDLGWNASGGAN